MRVHHINNLNKALLVLQEYDIKLVNISSNDIVSGNPKLTLGLIWLIALSFDGQKLVNSQQVSGIEKSLLVWVNKQTEVHGMRINDFSSSWADGRAFLYVLDGNIPQFDLKGIIKLHPILRLKKAFDFGLTHLHIEQLLDPEDVNTNKPDKKSILMYVMCLYNAIEKNRVKKGNISNMNFDGSKTETNRVAGNGEEPTDMDVDENISHHLAHHVQSMEEIQLLDERELHSPDGSNVSVVREDAINNNSEFNQRTTTTKTYSTNASGTFTTTTTATTNVNHPGNLTDLDEISLAQSVDDLRKSKTKKNSNVNIVKNIEHTEISNNNSNRLSTGDTLNAIRADSQFYWETKSRPTSTSTNFSIEIGGYQTAVEEVLTLLLEAEEIIAKDIILATNLPDARAQFHEHEEFMLKLSEHQAFVGAALEEGDSLISESQTTNVPGHALSPEEQSEIRHQLFLLTERWETLRVRAQSMQSKIHTQLADLQLEKVNELKNFLTTTEDRISRMSAIGPRPEELRVQLEEHQLLQKDLEEQQKLVENLSNLIIIVDSDCFADLEDKLTALEERWSHVVKWTATRWEKLQSLSMKWSKMTEQYRIICRWLDVRKHNMKALEGREVVEVGAIMERIKYLLYCKKDLEALDKFIVALDATAQSLHDEGYSTLNILDKIEDLNDNCEALHLILEVQQTRIESMGFKIPTDSIHLEKPEFWEDFQPKMAQTSNVSIFESVQSECTKFYWFILLLKASISIFFFRDAIYLFRISSAIRQNYKFYMVIVSNKSKFKKIPKKNSK